MSYTTDYAYVQNNGSKRLAQTILFNKSLWFYFRFYVSHLNRRMGCVDSDDPDGSPFLLLQLLILSV